MQQRPSRGASTDEPRDPGRRRLLRLLGVGATASALGVPALSGVARAHDLTVEFEGCQEVFIAVNDRDEFGVLEETIRILDAGTGEIREEDVELTPENTEPVPERFGDRPVYHQRVSGDDQIVAVEMGDGETVRNPNDCPPPEEEEEEDRAAAFAAEQDDRCVTLSPLSFEDQSVDEFYGYTSDVDEPDPRQSNFPVELTETATSRLFLFEDPDGLSLVVVHGGDDDPGGAASFEIDGVPDDAEWLVQDDGYEGSIDEFAVEDGTATADWAWGALGRNDGAALGYLGDEFELTVEAAFDGDAELEPINGPEAGVDAWQVLSGDVEDPDVTDLDLDEPVTVRSGDC